MYHEVISFSPEDKSVLSPEKLEDITREYLNKRCSQAIAYARIHFETENPHIHVIISANEKGRQKRIRLSKSEFQEIKLNLERYQKELYPEIKHSIAQKK